MPLKGTTILVVDDNVAHSYALGRILERAGSKVLRAHTGTAALEVAAQKPSLIVLDVNLPDSNGYEVCRRLRNHPATAKIPVVFLSATCQDSNARAIGESVGGNAFLFDPVEENQLISVITGQIAKSAEPERE